MSFTWRAAEIKAGQDAKSKGRERETGDKSTRRGRFQASRTKRPPRRHTADWHIDRQSWLLRSKASGIAVALVLQGVPRLVAKRVKKSAANLPRSKGPLPYPPPRRSLPGCDAAYFSTERVMSYWSRTIECVSRDEVVPRGVAVSGRALRTAFLASHAETEWSVSGQHTGQTDLPLTDRGERDACRLANRLRGMTFARIFTAPLQRSVSTCELAGFGGLADIEFDLSEWDYGKYEGLTAAQIYRNRPDWDLFRDGCPGGEAPEQVARRADRVIGRVREVDGEVLLFSGGHFLRVLAARWLGLPPMAGRYFVLGNSSLSGLGYEHNLAQPVVRFWDDNANMK